MKCLTLKKIDLPQRLKRQPIIGSLQFLVEQSPVNRVVHPVPNPFPLHNTSFEVLSPHTGESTK